MSMNVIPYVIFNGNCIEAMNFYKSHIGGELFSMTYGQAGQNGGCPEGAEDKIIHANLKNGSFVMFASDTPSQKANIGDNVQLYLSCTSREEVDRLYKGLGEKGKNILPPADAFWGAYFAMVVDQFNIHWMLGFETAKK